MVFELGCKIRHTGIYVREDEAQSHVGEMGERVGSIRTERKSNYVKSVRHVGARYGSSWMGQWHLEE